MKRVITIVLTLLLLTSLCIPCFAQEEQPTISPRYTYINSSSCSISISSAGSATCKASCTATSAAYKVKVACYFQYGNNGSWYSIRLWDDTDYLKASVNEQATIVRPYTSFRVKAVFSIYDSSDNLLETATSYDYATYTPST